VSTPQPAASIGPIAAVTVVTPSLTASEEAYGGWLGYRAVGRGRVGAAQAALWSAPDVAGAPYLLMAPAGADDFVFRFIERRGQSGYRAFSGHGWNAAELIVQRVDDIAASLAGSPFEIVAPPLDLSFCSDIRAMQVRGPGGEICYLTEFKRPVPGLDAPPARSAVDRTFIVIVGGPSLAGLQRHYAARFGVPESPPMESRVQTMALEFGMDRESRFRIAALPLAGRCYIEADEMPAAARPLPASGLPDGIAIVTFNGSKPAGTTPPAEEAPYRRASSVACERGAAGELIEVVA
jgi:hypothetical protein